MTNTINAIPISRAEAHAVVWKQIGLIMFATCVVVLFETRDPSVSPKISWNGLDCQRFRF